LRPGKKAEKGKLDFCGTVQPMINYRIRRHLLPSPSTMALLWGELAFVVVMSLCIGFMVLNGTKCPSLVISYTIIVIGPIGLLTGGIAVFLEKNNGARCLLWALTTLVFIVVSLVIAVSFDVNKTPQANAMVALICCGPVVFFTFACSIYFGLKAYPDYQRT